MLGVHTGRVKIQIAGHEISWAALKEHGTLWTRQLKKKSPVKSSTEIIDLYQQFRVLLKKSQTSVQITFLCVLNASKI